ncbi:MAG: hypothetical protein RR313_05695 [Anaerovoracaceae bacterium]
MNSQVNDESGYNKNLKVGNTEVPFDGWLPLTAVKNEIYKHQYNNIGYQIGHTAKEFEAEYPFVDTSKVFCSDEIVSYYYFDEDSLVLFVLPFHKKTYVSQTNEPFINWFTKMTSHEFAAVQKTTLEYYKLRLNPMFPLLTDDVKSAYLQKVLAKVGLFAGAPELLRTLLNDYDLQGS